MKQADFRNENLLKRKNVDFEIDEANTNVKPACGKICENMDEKDCNPAKGLKMQQIINQLVGDL